ncbi:MAG: YfhO family protein, partial [Chloroflexota bacterium]
TLERVKPGIFIVVPELAVVPAYPLNRYEEIAQIEEAKLYRNNLALPRALLVPKVTVVQDPSDALEAILDDSFDPRREAVLEGPGMPGTKNNDQHIGEVVISSQSHNSIRLEVRASLPGFLVLNELSYPGWNAYVDGQRTRVWRANYLFRAIEISPGDHEVEFRFEPDSMKLGLALSLPTLALLLTAAVYQFGSRQHRKEKTP